MNEDIKKYEAQKSTSYKEDQEKQIKINKRKIYFRWGISILISLFIGVYYMGAPTYFIAFFSIVWFWSVTVWWLMMLLLSIEVSFSKILMWTPIIIIIYGTIRDLTLYQ
tara:strand:- start:80 stop:406 length:327 start_codon:yes stop_codon:yes gene_type:complete